MQAEKKDLSSDLCLFDSDPVTSLPPFRGWMRHGLPEQKHKRGGGGCAWEITRGTWSSALILVTVKVKVCLYE